jgi:hypothetical protein
MARRAKPPVKLGDVLRRAAVEDQARRDLRFPADPQDEAVYRRAVKRALRQPAKSAGGPSRRRWKPTALENLLRKSNPNVSAAEVAKATRNVLGVFVMAVRLQGGSVRALCNEIADDIFYVRQLQKRLGQRVQETNGEWRNAVYRLVQHYTRPRARRT